MTVDAHVNSGFTRPVPCSTGDSLLLTIPDRRKDAIHFSLLISSEFLTSNAITVSNGNKNPTTNQNHGLRPESCAHSAQKAPHRNNKSPVEPYLVAWLLSFCSWLFSWVLNIDTSSLSRVTWSLKFSEACKPVLLSCADTRTQHRVVVNSTKNINDSPGRI